MKRLFVFILLSGLCACKMLEYVPQARDIKRKPRSGGVIALPAAQRAEDRTKAEELMRQNCLPLAFSIADEGEAVVGQQTKSSASEANRDDTRHKEGSFLGMNIMSGENAGKETSQSSVTTQLKEWQIVYNCEADKQTSIKKLK